MEVRLVASKLTSEVVGAALSGEGNAALNSGVTPWRGGMALGGSVALAAVGPLVIDRAMPAVVVGGDKIVFQRRST